MFEYFLKGLIDKEIDFIREINYIYDEVYRIYLIMTRQLITCQINRDLIEIIELENPLQLLEGRVIVSYLNDIGYELLFMARNAAKNLDKLELKTTKLRESLEDMIREIIGIINEWLNSYMQRDLIGLNKVYQMIDDEIHKIFELLEYPWKADVDELTANWVKRTLQTFIHIQHLMRNIILSSINTYIIRPPIGCAVVSEKEH